LLTTPLHAWERCDDRQRL